MMNIKIKLSILFLLFSTQFFAQESHYQMKGNEKEITIDILSSYYNQDGNNAAVTGGVGTELLTDIASVLIVNIPLDSVQSLSITAGADFYTSASTDNINSNNSSASSKDLRKYGTVSYSRKNLKKGETYSAKVGGSTEYDYNSISFGLAYAKEFNEGNSEINLAAQAFMDNWDLIYPEELRGEVSLPGSARNSYNFQASYFQVLNKRMQFSLSGEAIYMEGLLSTPFHRVYFENQLKSDIERLPDTRLKIPVGLRFNYLPADFMVVRSYYRFYTDSWGLTAHTMSLETPLKVKDWLTISPFFRYHKQNAADYFAPFAEHLTDEQFYTSDYDLSALTSKKIGLGFRIAPTYGIGRFKMKKKLLMFKELNLRTAYYQRSTGLNSFIGSVNLSFVIK